MKRRLTAYIAFLLAITMLLAACGKKETNETGSGGKVDVADKIVELKAFMYSSGNFSEAILALNEKFMEKNPGIKIEHEFAPVDKYESLIKTKLAAGDAPDLFSTFPGKKQAPFVEAGHLMDLSDQPWVERMYPGVKAAASVDDKVYAMPRLQATIGVMYNKKIFNDLNLKVPENWDEFLEVCQAIKDSGIIPIALGLKDNTVTQMIPYAMAPSAIYRDQPDFDALMEEGKQTFAGSPWEQMMADYLQLNELGYLSDNLLGTGLDSMLQMMATEEAAMVVIIDALVAQLRAMNPNLELGMFPLPYVKPGEKVWVSANTGLFSSINAQTEHPEEAKKYLAFIAEPENYKQILGNSASAFTDVESVMDPAPMEMVPYMENGTYPWLDVVWPATVQPTLMSAIQEIFVGSSIDEMMTKLDEAFKEGNE